VDIVGMTGSGPLIRKAEGEPFSAVIGVPVSPADVTVYRA
jgi:hypothetical protein